MSLSFNENNNNGSNINLTEESKSFPFEDFNNKESNGKKDSFENSLSLDEWGSQEIQMKLIMK